MTRTRNKLTVRTCEAIARSNNKEDKRSDGGGLYLWRRPPARCSWLYLFTFGGKPLSMGLGAYPQVGPAEARAKRDRNEERLRRGINPKEAENPRTVPFGEAAEAYLAAKECEWRNNKHRAQWRTTLRTYCAPIWGMPVDAIDTADVLSVLKPIWQSRAETASRLRGRIEAVLDAAKAHGQRQGENPGRWRGHLDKLLPKRQKLTRGHHAAMPYAEVPAFMARLRERESIDAMALEFTILTAARSGEALGGRWSEIDFDAKVWVVPPSRMKTARSHRAALSGRAIAVLKKLHEATAGDFIFPGRGLDRPLSPMALAMLLRRMGRNDITVHGFRSAFRDWCGEETHFPREIAEAALAHVIGDKAEQAYRRGDALERRRALMEAWASFCEGGGNVLPMRAVG